MNTMWRSSAIFSLCAVIAAIGSSIGWYFRAPPLLPGAVAVLILCSLILGALLIVRNKPFAETFASWMAILTMTIFAIFIAYNHEYFVRNAVVFRAYLGTKALALLLPMVCPPRRWVGWTMLAVLTLVPVVQFLLWEDANRMVVGIQEPYVTVIVVIASGIIYHYKLRYSELLASEIESNIHTKALQRFASMLIASQHLINTPLQKIEIMVSLMLSENRPEDRLMESRLKENFEIIRRVTRVLSFADGNTQWESLELPANAKELEDHARQVLKEFQTPSQS